MWVCGRISDRPARAVAACIAAAALWCAGPSGAQDRAGQGAPARVVSINLCTDQLAMLLAAPGQLVSVSMLARERKSSALADLAVHFPVNSGSAEEVFLLRPDLVLAGRYAARDTVRLLRRLGVTVAEFAPETSLDEVRATIARMGRLLGREAAAQAMLQDFDARLAALRPTRTGPPPIAALYGANGYMPGTDTLSDDILAAAGLGNLAATIGLTHGGAVPLERLILARPDVVIRAARYDGQSRAEAILDHPALRGLPLAPDTVTGADWVCPTPMLLNAVADMAARRDKLSR